MATVAATVDAGDHADGDNVDNGNVDGDGDNGNVDNHDSKESGTNGGGQGRSQNVRIPMGKWWDQ